ncbi:hypothetical protein M8J76_010886 [Diaphorina citri]|nr:hypothetical protein M8J76_010886 [Diaphorina citri]
MLPYLTMTLLCLSQTSVYCLENEYFITHLLKNLKNDILHLKPGSNKTYILNSKLLGRNDSIELDIKSRKGVSKNKEHDKENALDLKELHKDLNELHKHHAKHSHLSLAERRRRKLRNKIRKAMLKEFEDIHKNHALKIRKIMKHKEHINGRKKIKIKVLRKHLQGVKVELEPEIANKTEGKPKVKVVKKIKLYRMAPARRKKVHHNGVFAYDSNFGSGYEEGGQIPELFLGDEFDDDHISAMFQNTKNLEVFQKTTTTPTTTTTTPTTTKNPKDDYTYEYVYEDELDKGRGFKKEKSEPGQKHRRKGATSDEYTYEYIYEDEMKKSKPIIVTSTTPQTTTTTPTTTPASEEHIIEEYSEEESDGIEPPESGVKEPVKLSPSVERDVRLLQELEHNHTRRTVPLEELYGDSNSQYKEPERFKTEYSHDIGNESNFTLEYDWLAPAATTEAVTHLIAESSIMYDDEDTHEFLAERNRTKLERGYDSYPRDMFFTIDLKDFKTRYTRPSATPEDYYSADNEISMWQVKDKLRGVSLEETRRNRTTTLKPFVQTKAYNVTRSVGQLYNITINDKMEVKRFDVQEFVRNASRSWMRNVTERTTEVAREDDQFVTMDDLNKYYHVPQYLPNRKLRRYKRDLGHGMKMPRRQYEALVYLFQKVNNTRWLARLRKMKDAPNLMECLIRRTKRKQNKKSIVYKQKALKPKKRPKGPKRVVLKKRKPKVNKRIERIRLGAKRRREKQGKKRRRRSVDEIVYSQDHDGNIVGDKYIDIKELERFKRSLEIDEVKLVRKKRNVEKVSDDLLHDFEMNPTDMHGTIENMTQIFQANLLETHKIAIDKAMAQAIEQVENTKNISEYTKMEEVKIYRTFICEYKQLMEEWFVNTFFDVPNAMRRYAKKNIFKLRKDRVPSTPQINKFFEYDNYLTIRLEHAERVIRTTLKHFYDELEDKVFGYFYGFEKAQDLLKDPYEGTNRTTLSDRDLLRLLAKTTPFDPDVKRMEMKEAREHMVGPTNKYGSTLQPMPDVRWK